MTKKPRVGHHYIDNNGNVQHILSFSSATNLFTAANGKQYTITGMASSFLYADLTEEVFQDVDGQFRTVTNMLSNDVNVTRMPNFLIESTTTRPQWIDKLADGYGKAHYTRIDPFDENKELNDISNAWEVWHEGYSYLETDSEEVWKAAIKWYKQYKQ